MEKEMQNMPDERQLRAGAKALRGHKPVPVMSTRAGISVDYTCRACATRFPDLEAAQEHAALRIVEAVRDEVRKEAMPR